MITFKEIYLQENNDEIKSAKAHAKGLTHIAFDVYKDKSGANWYWNQEKSDFEKTSIIREIDKLIQNRIKYIKRRQDRTITITKLEDFLYKDSDDRYYYYDERFNSLSIIVKSEDYTTDRPEYIKEKSWNKIMYTLAEKSRVEEEKKKKELEYWESKQKDLTPISDKIMASKEIKEAIKDLSFLTIPKDYKQVTIKETDDLSHNIRAGGSYYVYETNIEVKKGYNKSTIFHEIGHWLDYGGETVSKTHYTNDHEFSKLIKKVKSLPTIKKLQDINSNQEYKNFNDETVIPDQNMDNYVRYLMKPDEIFARLFSQYICSKFNYPIYNTNDIPNQWPSKEFEEIKDYMDEMFKRMGWMK